MSKTVIIKIFLLLLACLLVSCSSSTVKPVAKFTLMHPSKIKFQRKQHRPSIYVSEVVANSAYKGNDLVYMDKPYQIKKFSKNSWIAPPAELLHGLLIESIQNSDLYSAVNAPPYSGISNYRLDTQLITLRHEFLQKPSIVRLVAEITVVNLKNHHIIAQKRFHVVTVPKEDSPYGGVVATNEAVLILFSDIVHYLAALDLH